MALAALFYFKQVNKADAIVHQPTTAIYTSDAGEKIEAVFQSPDVVEVHFMQAGDDYLKAFTAERVQSASGAKYESTDGRFVFWAKGSEASIFHKNGDSIFQGDENPDKMKEEWMAGLLVYGHESQIFQPCGSKEELWVTDPNNLIRATYDSLTQGKEPYTEVYAEVVGMITPVSPDEDGFASEFARLLTVSAISMEPAEKYPSCGEQQGQETIYYSASRGQWRDDVGACHTCTAANGFGTDGTVDNIAWREIWLSLKNDANEYPPIDEVKQFFTAQHAEKSGHYPVHISQEGTVYKVIIPVPKELKSIDFFDKKGALLATYDVIEHNFQNRSTKNKTTIIRHSSIDPVADEKTARAFAEKSEIYVQDGHNIRLRDPQLFRCAACFDYVFDHYGDPDVPYYISVRVLGDGRAEYYD